MKMRGPKSGFMAAAPIPKEPEQFTDLDSNKVYNIGEPFIDIGNGTWDKGEDYLDVANGVWDEGEDFVDALNGLWDEGEKFTDENGNGRWDNGEPLFSDLNGNGVMDEIMEYYYDPNNQSTIQNSIGGLTPIQEENHQDLFEDLNGDNFWTLGEPYEDQDGDGKYTSHPYFWDFNGDALYTTNESFEDILNGVYDFGEEFTDLKNGKWDDGEELVDRGNGVYDVGMKVVLLDLDDESYRILSANEPWPYHRGRVWGKIIRNLTNTGAKVIVFDFEFDAPDSQSESALGILRQYKNVTGFDVDQALLEGTSKNLEHGDDQLAESVLYARSMGTKVVFGSKLVNEPTRVPPQYISHPSSRIMNSEPYEGLVNSIDSGVDGVSREYPVFLVLNNMENDSTFYHTLAVNAVSAYLDIPKETLPFFDLNTGTYKYGPLNIKTLGRTPLFFINYYGPNSSANPFGKPYNTFYRYPLANVMDDEDYDIGDDDSDWMSSFDPTSSFNQMMFEMDPEYEIMESPFKDKIVMIGASTEVFHDTKETPFFSYKGNQSRTPGMEMHSNAIQQILDGSYIKVVTGSLQFNDQSRWNHILIILGISFFTFFVIFKLDPKYGAMMILLEIIVWLSYSMGGFSGDYFWLFRFIPGLNNSQIPIANPALIPVVFPMATIFLTYGINVAYKLISEGKDKAFLKSAFGNYISPELIDDMFDNKQAPALGGDNGMRTAYFTDIASFSTFSEKLTATELVMLLNEYLTVMTDILLSGGGTLDKYEGDAIIAFFGAPMEQPDNALRGLKVAVEMQNGCDMLRKKWQSEGDKWPEVVKQMRTRIGINHGDLVCGNMGAENRMNYTMMGDTVNTAARLEEGAKQYGIYTATTIETLEVAGKENFEWRIVDKTRYMGKSMGTTTVEILDFKGKISSESIQMIETFNKGFKLYQEMKWDEAIKVFKESEKHEDDYPGRPTNPSKKLISRCEEYKENPPVNAGDEWDGVYTMTKK
jgi:adenylate cyclase